MRTLSLNLAVVLVALALHGCASSPSPARDAGVPTDGAAADAGARICKVSCSLGLTCCEAGCVNLHNDIRNCGSCGVACGGAHPYCDGVCCTQAPCTNPQLACLVGFCCGSRCCGRGQICCAGANISQGPTCVSIGSDGGACPTS